MTISAGRNKTVSIAGVEPARDRRSAPGDERFMEGTSGGWRGTTGDLIRSYGWVALLILATCLVNVLTALQHSPGPTLNLRGPIVDECSSAFVLIAMLPLLKRSVDAFSSIPDRRVAFIIVALAVITYALSHVTLCVLLRQMIYPAFGLSYDFRWRTEFAAEFRKDVISALMILVVFWLIDRRAGAGSPSPDLQASRSQGSGGLQPGFWLKDGTASIRVDPTQLICVTSAGNYVEFALPGRSYLVRGTLAGEASRLKPFGVVRVHRTKLVNANRIVAIERRANGDFALRMDNGETIAASRRYKDVLVSIKGAGNGPDHRTS